MNALDNEISLQIRRFGYAREKTMTYKRTQSGIEHFIYLSSDSKNYFVARFGFRSPLIEAFSLASLLKYGHPNRRLGLNGFDSDVACLLSYDFGRFSNWPRTKIIRGEELELAGQLSVFVEGQLCAIVDAIDNLDGYCRFLCDDVEPCPWFASSSAVRAFQILALGEVLNARWPEIYSALERESALVLSDLSDLTSDGQSFLSRYGSEVRSDWQAWKSQNLRLNSSDGKV